MNYLELKTHNKMIKLPEITYEALNRKLPLFFEDTGSRSMNTFIISILNEALRDTIEEIRKERKNSETTRPNQET